MLCDKCKTKEAKIYYTEIVSGVKREQHLCEDCAAELTSFQKEIPLDSILSGLFGMSSESERVCPGCKMTYQEFRHSGRIGCAECYRTFGRLLQGDIKRMQGAVNHTGKISKSYEEKEKTFIKNEEEKEKTGEKPAEKENRAELEAALKRAIAAEEYEEAARLRDRIRALNV